MASFSYLRSTSSLTVNGWVIGERDGEKKMIVLGQKKSDVTSSIFTIKN